MTTDGERTEFWYKFHQARESRDRHNQEAAEAIATIHQIAESDPTYVPDDAA